MQQLYFNQKLRYIHSNPYLKTPKCNNISIKSKGSRRRYDSNHSNKGNAVAGMLWLGSWVKNIWCSIWAK